jgi:hypothetical protein
VAALARFERAALLFEPSFELGTCHTLQIQQKCCFVNRNVAWCVSELRSDLAG